MLNEIKKYYYNSGYNSDCIISSTVQYGVLTDFNLYNQICTFNFEREEHDCTITVQSKEFSTEVKINTKDIDAVLNNNQDLIFQLSTVHTKEIMNFLEILQYIYSVINEVPEVLEEIKSDPDCTVWEIANKNELYRRDNPNN